MFLLQLRTSRRTSKFSVTTYRRDNFFARIFIEEKPCYGRAVVGIGESHVDIKLIPCTVEQGNELPGAGG